MAASGTNGGDRSSRPGRDRVQLAQHGYDQSEFAPEQCDRDFSRARRLREPDEERRLLRQADAAIGRKTGEETERGADGRWGVDDDLSVDGSSRLYKD